ncbi:hypothetical protein CLHUN_32270 [Ruminiclostridium hungatei]|uniref:DUF445 domain-containing protein n=1 Tax=Ruminiclostridium hungatei TaxID=48256 RepID=A0A1V4SGP3_RUMHU|nr:DUF445 domain-containing protein [Ruminiclostridium hungatei]OPX42903.1 hypothetical protein CLHUN_32270 [Ruminiclostridium hungatei]
MEKYDYKNEELKLRVRLRNMKILATSLLVFMAVVFAVMRRYEDRGLLYSSITAFAEASMVGALADWFAVVALFRHPLGLRIIPHTAIIQNNKQRIAKALSGFVVSNFFTPELIKDKLDKMELSSKLAGYISANGEILARGAAQKLPALMDTLVDDSKLKMHVSELIIGKIRDMKLYPALAGAVKPLVEGGHHKPLVRALLTALSKYIGENKEKTLQVLAGINKTLAMPIIGDLIYKKILEFLLEQIDAIETDDNSEINRLVLSALPKLLEDMSGDEELIQKGEQLKNQLVSSQGFSAMVDKLGETAAEFKNSILKNEAKLQAGISSALKLAAGSLAQSPELRKNIDATVTDLAVEMVKLYGDKVGSLIYDTMDGWETKDMVDKLEVQVGADLQYIRINGTVIGGLAGLAIHLLTRLF